MPPPFPCSRILLFSVQCVQWGLWLSCEWMLWKVDFRIVCCDSFFSDAYFVRWSFNDPIREMTLLRKQNKQEGDSFR